MQFDQNRFVIRERSLLDVMDLALRVIRMYAWPLGVTFLCGVAPAMCVNAWLLAEWAEAAEFNYQFGFVPYMWWMLMLVIWEMPLVTAPMTLLLGQALFTDRPQAREIVRDLTKSLPPMLWYQGVLRALCIPLLITWFVPFAVWPYSNEVILLEGNPIRRRPGKMSVYQRMLVLHKGYVAELFSRWLASIIFGGLLFLSFWLSIWVMGGVLVNEWTWGGPTYTICFPLALWLVIGYSTVVRFLGYLDLRIRREGWDIELMMRAEQTRLTRQLT